MRLTERCPLLRNQLLIVEFLKDAGAEDMFVHVIALEDAGNGHARPWTVRGLRGRGLFAQQSAESY